MKAAIFAGAIGLASANCRGHAEGTCLSPAFDGDCKAPSTHQYGKELPVQMRQQWDDSDGYCGSLATQNILLSQGAYVSQDHVRRAVPGTDRGPGTGAELYYENIGPAMDTLKWRHDDWDWRHEQQPQWKNYLVWMKRHIINGEGIVWMIKDAAFELKQYNHTDEGIMGPSFGHEEPVFGIYSKHPLTDTSTYYDDDVLVHGSDYCAGSHVEGPRNYRLFSSLPDEQMRGNCAHAQGTIGQYPCINEQQNLGFAVLGPVEEEKSIRVHLMLDRFDEPDNDQMNLRNPVDIKGTVTVEGPLEVGEKYAILRWNDFKKVPTTGKYLDSEFDDSHTFVATAETYVYEDPKPFQSTGTTYYRCVKGAAGPTPPPPTPAPTPTPSPPPTPGACHAISAVVTDDWCVANCAAGFCPADLCKCDGVMV
jgi:hypothetical protein